MKKQYLLYLGLCGRDKLESENCDFFFFLLLILVNESPFENK